MRTIKFVRSGNNMKRMATNMAALSAKELSALEDLMTVEQNVISKYRMYAQTSSDTAIRNKCESVAGKHQQHFDKLMSILNA